MFRFKRNIPNILSVSRPVLIIPFIILLAQDRTIASLILAAVIVVSDYLDGLLARYWNAISDTGKLLDPIADKISTAAGAIALIYYRDFPVWLTLVVVGRDILILLGGLILIRRKKAIPVSDFTGKVAMVVLSGCLLTYLFRVDFAKYAFALLTVMTQAASIYSYGRRFIRTIFER